MQYLSKRIKKRFAEMTREGVSDSHFKTIAHDTIESIKRRLFINNEIDINSPKQVCNLRHSEKRVLNSIRKSIIAHWRSIYPDFKGTFFDLPKGWLADEKIQYWLLRSKLSTLPYWFDSKYVDISIGTVSELLCECEPHDLYVWFDHNKFNWENHSSKLVLNTSLDIKYWWDPLLFNFKDSMHHLVTRSNFYWLWWKPEYFPDQKELSEAMQLGILQTLCVNVPDLYTEWKTYTDKFMNSAHLQNSRWYASYLSNYFDEWWKGQSKFIYSFDSMRSLVVNSPDKFDEWWNPVDFNLDWWKKNPTMIIASCPDKIEKWWSEELLDHFLKIDQFSERNPLYMVIEICEDFLKNIWCNKIISKWGNGDMLWVLMKYKHKSRFDIWGPDYIIHKSQKE